MDEQKIHRVHVPAKPVAKGRARFSKQTGAAYTPKQTVVAEAWVRLCCTQQVGSPRVPGPVAVRVVFVVPIPRSMPKAQRAAAERGELAPTRKPDWDNLAKLASDALNGIAWADDAEVTSAGAWKVYGAEPCTVIAWWHMTPAAVALEHVRALAEVGGIGEAPLPALGLL